ELLRVRRYDRGHDRQLVERRDAVQRLLGTALVTDHVNQTRANIDPKEIVLKWRTQIGVDEQRAFPELCEYDGEIGRHGAAHVVAPRRADGKGALLVAEPAHEQLTTQRAH